MSTAPIPTRANLQVIDQTWFNVLQDVLGGNLVPRNSSGVPTTLGGSLGTSTYAFNQACMAKLGLLDSSTGFQTKIQAYTGLAADYTLTLPAALPGATARMQMDSSGNIFTNSSVPVKSSSSGSFTTSSMSYADVTNLTLSLTTSGRPVMVMLMGGSTGSSVLSYAINDFPGIDIKFIRGSTDIYVGYASDADATGNKVVSVPPASFAVIDTPTAGTYTYKCQTQTFNSGNGTLTFTDIYLIAFEL